MYPWLTAAIQDSTVIVTASRRLALDLHRSHTRQMLESGHQSWRTPEIHFRGGWLDKLIDSANLDRPWPVRINQGSAAILWERCLARHAPDPLLNIASVVRLAGQAWRRMNEYTVPLEQLSRFARSTDQEQFASAARTYHETLVSNNWVDAAMLPALVADAVRSGAIVAPESVVLAGFDRVSPAMQRIIKELRNQKCDVEIAGVSNRNVQLVTRSFRNRQQEFRAAGRWARQKLFKAPVARVAIICPDLNTNAPAATRLVREGFAPGWQYSGEAARNAVEVSYGRRLCDFPAISVALLLLRWIQQGLPSRDIGLLLRSPFIVSAGLAGRSRCELELRQWPDRSWTPASLAALLRGREKSADTTLWLAAIERIVTFRAEHRGDATPAQWAERFDRLLTAMGWPGVAPQDSAGYQLLNRWRTLLAEFAATGLVSTRDPMSAAIDRICSMASEVIFQPELDGGPVQLLGTLEASGLSFDFAWVCGLDSARWPPPPNPLALISRTLQEMYGMPDGTPRDSLEFAEQVLQRICASASQVVLSWASSDGETELLPSPLLASLSLPTDESLADPGWHAMQLQDATGLTELRADSAPPVSPGEKVAGGAHTVQMQSSEPFSAFAHGRLRIREMRRIESGLPAAFKGSLMHQVLHAFLSDKPGFDIIAGWTDAEIGIRVDRAVSKVVKPAQVNLNTTHRKLLELESQRMRTILRNFVAAERLRPRFAIEHVENRIEFERFGVRLQLRVDRIDRLSDGSRLIIDYKTGMPKSLLDRDGDLLDLQLVVYALAAGGPIGGLALINIDSREIVYKGTGGSVDWDARRRDDWDMRLAGWITTAEGALRNLANGDVRIAINRTEQNPGILAILSRVAELKRVG